MVLIFQTHLYVISYYSHYVIELGYSFPPTSTKLDKRWGGLEATKAENVSSNKDGTGFCKIQCPKPPLFALAVPYLEGFIPSSVSLH